MKKSIKGIVKSALLKLHCGVIIEWWHSYVRTYLLWKYRWNHRKAFLSAWREQCRYDQTELKQKTVVAFILYRKMMVNGGFMSIFNIASTSRDVLEDAAVVLCTGPGNPDIYSRNVLFLNKEKVWRWGQIRHATNGRLEKLILHIPECYIGDFLCNLSKKDKKFLHGVPDLRINIMNQNILLMPERKALAGLYDYTDKVTQTTAHGKYNSQEMSDKYGLPTMRVGTYMSYDDYKRYDWDTKEKIVAYSPDYHPMREEILETLKHSLPDFSFVEIKGLTFWEYMDLIARAMVVITFGEGLDGYFSQPAMMGTLSFSVYNTDFFTSNQGWLSLTNLFKSYEEMRDRISGIIVKAITSKEVYYGYVKETRDILLRGRLTKEGYIENIRRFYKEEFDYYPKTQGEGLGEWYA